MTHMTIKIHLYGQILVLAMGTAEMCQGSWVWHNQHNNTNRSFAEDIIMMCGFDSCKENTMNWRTGWMAKWLQERTYWYINSAVNLLSYIAMKHLLFYYCSMKILFHKIVRIYIGTSGTPYLLTQYSIYLLRVSQAVKYKVFYSKPYSSYVD